MIETLGGTALILAVLVDVFLTVLYARAGKGLLNRYIGRAVWRLFRRAARHTGRFEPLVFSYFGPALLLMVLAVWAVGLTVACALIIHPHLGTSVVASSGATPRDFVTAMYVGGSSIAVVGDSNFFPRTPPFKIFFLFTSLVGMTVISLTLTYLMQVYNALQRRNTFALTIHAQSGETGNAAELLAGLGPEGQFMGGYTNISELATGMASLKEAHHFYPVLFYFRFPEELYAVSRFSLIALDTVTLIKTALDDREYAWLKESVAVDQLARSTRLLLDMLTDNFVIGGANDGTPDQATRDRWKRRYGAALRRLQQAGIRTRADEPVGADMYVTERAGWDGYITALAPSMSFAMPVIDRASFEPESLDREAPFRARLRSVR